VSKDLKEADVACLPVYRLTHSLRAFGRTNLKALSGGGTGAWYAEVRCILLTSST
jgi:hypothetical protein